MKKKGKLVWVTGISGCRRKDYLDKWRIFCGKKGKRIKIYNVGQMMFPWAKQYCGLDLDSRYVLNTPEHTLNAIRGGVFESILGGEERSRLNRELEEYDAVVISVHNKFLWKKCMIRAYASSFLSRFNPDMFVSFVDPSEVILERLNSREQWQGQNLTEDDILWWQEAEVDSTIAFPEWLGMDKKWVAMPSQQPLSFLYFLLFEPWRPLMYAQMAISHAGAEEEREKKLERIMRFISNVSDFFPILNPLLIKTGNIEPGTVGTKQDHQTVKRDNKWYIGACDITIANILEPVFTPGVIDEMREAQDTNKESWAIFAGGRSPFLEHRLTPERVFQTATDFFKFIKEYQSSLFKKWERDRGKTK
ncbi:MAG: hypothetical protein ABII97_01215 [Patescibacteria group bacterium]